MRVISAIGLMLLVYTQAPAQHTIASASNFSEVSTGNRIFLVLTTKPTTKEKAALEYFLMNDEKGRDLIHDVLFSNDEPAFIGISNEKNFPGKNTTFIACLADTAQTTHHLRRQTIKPFMDSVAVSLSSTTSVTSADGMATIIMLNVAILQSIKKDLRNKSNGGVVITPYQKGVYVLSVDKNTFRGGPRFRRASVNRRH